MRSRLIGRGVAVLGALMWASAALAQSDFPNHTIKIVVPTPPGASLDTLPRLIANRLSKRWNVPVIIENMPGAAQNLTTIDFILVQNSGNLGVLVIEDLSEKEHRPFYRCQTLQQY